jgi:cysteine desulfurase
LSEAFGDRIVLNGHKTLRLSGTLNVSFLGFVGGELLARVPEICASTGAACHSGDAKPSAVLTAMGISRERAIGAVRFSIGRPTTEDEIDRAIGLIVRAANSDRPIH